jgi:hypothetical protein
MWWEFVAKDDFYKLYGQEGNVIHNSFVAWEFTSKRILHRVVQENVELSDIL